ncbi:MAG: LysM peptidoglycan-binding domain-containing protein [Lachnospiraceae bacterium]|nr:LysM peptidoglycan-binding domain-containing protein [Lachnospiraceae bacterium]
MSTKNRTNRNKRRNIGKNRGLVVAIVFAVMFVTLFFVEKGGSVAFAADEDKEPLYKYYTTITVEEDMTLWEIAEEYNYDVYYDSINDYIDEVKNINSLRSDTIHSGAKLVVVYFSNEYK